MNIIPGYVDFAVILRLQLSPLNIAMLLALGLCMAVVWKWAKGRIG